MNPYITSLIRPFSFRSRARLGTHVLGEALEPRTLLMGANFEARGWVSIIVDETVAPSLSQKLARFRQDLIGDGWRVTPTHLDAPRMDDENYVWKNELPNRGPITNANFLLKQNYVNELQQVKNMIAADAAYANAAGGELKQVIFVGHVTVPYSGEFTDHDRSARATDLYYADFDASPQSWGDYKLDFLSPNGNDTAHETVTNQPGDGRFDTNAVPRDAQTITLTGGSGSFTVTFTRLEPGTSNYITDTTDPIPLAATAEELRSELNLLSSVSLYGGFVDVQRVGNVFTVTLLGSLTVVDQQQFTAAGTAGPVVATVPNGGIEISIGRIDMAHLDAAYPFDDDPLVVERTLLHQYFERDHAWRTDRWTESNLALSDIFWNNYNIDSYLAMGVGSENIVHEKWLSEFGEQNPTRYLFASAMEGGSEDAVWDNTGIPHPRVTSYHFDETPARAVFTFGGMSWMNDWNGRSLRNLNDEPNFLDENDNPIFPTDPEHLVKANFLKAPLGAAGDTLVSMHANFARGLFDSATPLALGYTAGDGWRYHVDNYFSSMPIALLGDPTIRESFVKPVTNLQQTINLSDGSATVTWTGSADTIDEYRVYHSDSLAGQFVRDFGTITANGENSFTFTDTSPDGKYVYMVRAVREEQTAAGEYDNASTGALPAEIVLQGAGGAQTVYIKRQTSEEHDWDALAIWDNATATGSPDYELDARTTLSVRFKGEAGDDRLIVDFADGNAAPPDGIVFGGDGGDDTLTVLGTGGPDTVAFEQGTTPVAGAISQDEVERIEFDGALGGDALSVADDVVVVFTAMQELASLDLQTSGTIDLR